MVAFLGAQLRPGIEAVLDLVQFDARLDGCDLVLTGEGRLDTQSVRGKVISRRGKARQGEERAGGGHRGRRPAGGGRPLR